MDTPNSDFVTKVSIIVPAYNVERYIEKCISSIVNQTYQNIEVVVVDDGSTDKTGQLIEAMAQKDGRVRVIHNPNSGVSSARNNGIELSTGDYLIFVDADDYLAQDYIEYMLSLANESGAEFCLSRCCFTQRGEQQTENEHTEKLTPEDATALLLSPAVIVGCWNKIFKRSLVIDNNIRFSTTQFYGEGLSFIIKMAQISNLVCVGNRKVYYYRRSNEMSATTKFDINKLYNGEKTLNMIGNQLAIISPKIITMLNLHLCLFSLGALVKIKTNHMEKRYLDDYRRWKSYIRHNTFNLVFNHEVPIYRKLLLIGGCASPWLMTQLDICRRNKIVGHSIS